MSCFIEPGLISSLIVKEITATSVLVTWVPLPLEKGTIDGYKVRFFYHSQYTFYYSKVCTIWSEIVSETH